MKIDQHISELLYHHDCVIVPGFGGFVTNSQPARIHPVQHQFYPPSKSLGFNIHLRRNDGLLANNISQIEIVSYEEALRLITDFVNSCNDKLNQDKSCAIEKVGKLYFDVEKNLRFEADNSTNYLMDSFGLTIIQSPPIKRDTLKDKVEKQVKYREPLKPLREGEKRKFPWKTALILPVIGLFVWASVQTINVYKHNSDTGNLNPFGNSSIPKTEIKKETAPDVIPQEEVIIEDTIEIVEAETTVNAETPSTELIESIPEAATPVIIEEKAAEVVSSGKRYFIIAGAFAVPENAEKLISQLKQKGYAHAAIIDTTRQGLHVVAYNEGFASYSDAMQNLNTMKSEENSAAWLMKK
ncbi:MAG: SPOR domain-containing protein [Bacteroidia bacterium]